MATKTGTSGNNTLNGTTLADRLNGLGGNDTLNGANGNDTLDGGTGNDRLNGGAGNDFYLITANPGTDTFVDSGGTDTVLSTVTYSIANKAMIENLTLQGNQAINGTGNEGGNTITGNSANNRLIGNGGSDRLIGGAGTGKDTLEGGAGNDTLDGGAGNDSLIGGSGIDTLQGGTGNDVLIWDANDRRLDGGTGKDILKVMTDGTVNLTAESETMLGGMETVDLAGDNTLKLTADEITDGFTDATATVKGAAEDSVIAGSGWTQLANSGAYAVYEKDGATLRVDRDIDRDGVIVESMTLGALDGENGFRLSGATAGDRAGAVVKGAGDINGDGYDDFVVGTQGYGDYQGATYVVFGTPEGHGANVDLSGLDGTTGFLILGAATNDDAGKSVAAAGDVNGDGFGDLVIGAWGADPHGGMSGATYVVFGTGEGFASRMDLGLLDGTNGFRISGVAEGDRSGWSVSGGTDVNGDGYDDLILGATEADPHGYSSGAGYVVFGKASFASNIELSTLSAENGFRISGADASYNTGYSVGSAGDMNGDGLGDLVIGALGADANGAENSGATYVVFGSVTGIGTNLDLTALDGSNGFRISGAAASDQAGQFLSGAGDVNGDGLSDLILGSVFVGGAAGAAYVIFGTDGGFASNLDLTALDGTNGFRISGEATGDFAGRSVSGAGDVNGDGYDDLLIGATFSDAGAEGAGAAYVVFGSGSGFASNLDLETLNGMNGFRLTGEAAQNYAGFSVSGADDIDGDGFADILVGAYQASPNGSQSGAGYLVHGRDFNGVVDFQGGTGPDSLIDGTSEAEVFVAGGGIDVMFGGGGADVFRGGAGTDLIIVADAGFADVDGGSGVDTLALEGSFHLDLTAIADGRITGIEVIDLMAGVSSAGLTVTAREILNLSGTNTLTVDGGAGDYVSAGGGWTQLSNDDGYARYVKDGATLRVDLDINRSEISSTSFSLDALDGASGFQIRGAEFNSSSGRSVHAAGDVNGDGLGDVVIGARTGNSNGQFSGAAYVVFGGEAASAFAGGLDLSALDGTTGFRIVAENEGDRLGISVASAGDVNGDGFGDVIVGAFYAEPGGAAFAGASYVIFGTDEGFAADFQATDLDGTNGFRIDGAATGDYSGISVSGAGDVNGDGYSDLIVGAYWADPHGSQSGAAYVVFGAEGGFGPSLDLTALDGTSGFRIAGEETGDLAGISVSAAGDVNDDGYDDVIVGAPTADGSQGAAYVVYGAADGFAPNLDLSALDGTSGFRIFATASGDQAASVSAAGDVNGDGIADLIVGAPYADPNGEAGAGATYVVFGRATGFGAGLALSAIDGTNGFRISGVSEGDRSGASVAAAGDFNGDGIGDLIIGARFASPGGTYSGATYVVLGDAGGFASNLDLTDLDGVNGFILTGAGAGDFSGVSVSAAGDVNGDGFADLIIGASEADPNGQAGAGTSYVVYGRDLTGSILPYLPGDDSVTGAGGDNFLVGALGADTLIGGGGADVLHGGAGDDYLQVSDTGFALVDGGSGVDTLSFDNVAPLDFSAFAGGRITGIERVDLVAGSGTNQVILTIGDLLGLSDTSNTLIVDGDGDDTFTIDGMWVAAGMEGDYEVYQAANGTAARILVDPDVVLDMTVI